MAAAAAPAFGSSHGTARHHEKSPLLHAVLAKGGSQCSSGASAAPEQPAPPASRVARAVLIGFAHIACSAGLILFNKYVMSPDRFPYAVSLTAMHMLAAFLLSSLLRWVAPQLFPSADAVFGGGAGAEGSSCGASGKPRALGQMRSLWPFVPIGACCAVSVVSANSAYNFASVSFLQMVKESVVLWVYLLGVLAGLEPLRLQYLAVLVFVTCSAALAVCSEARFRWPGLILQLVSSLTQASQAVLMNRLMTYFRGPKVDPLSLVMGSAPVVLSLLLPVTCSLWDETMTARLARWWHVLLVNALAAFALQVVNAVTIRELSATGLALAAVLKDLAIVASAAAVLHESLSRFQIVGFAGAVCGIGVYSAMKLRQALPKAPPPEAESSRNPA